MSSKKGVSKMVFTLKQIQGDSIKAIRKGIKSELAGVRVAIKALRGSNIRVTVSGFDVEFKPLVRGTVKKIVRRESFRAIMRESNQAKRGEAKTALIVLRANDV